MTTWQRVSLLVDGLTDSERNEARAACERAFPGVFGPVQRRLMTMTFLPGLLIARAICAQIDIIKERLDKAGIQ